MEGYFREGDTAYHGGFKVTVMEAYCDAYDYLVTAGNNDIFSCDEKELTKEISIRVGSVVIPIDPRNALRCGSGVYDDAVVISMEPYVMASRSSDMRWSRIKIEDYKAVNHVTNQALDVCMRRLDK
jgi:hypothetical protein